MKPVAILRLAAGALLAVTAPLFAAEPSGPSSAAPASDPSTGRESSSVPAAASLALAGAPLADAAERTPAIEHDGQTFELVNRTSGKNVETAEYVVAGEKIADWTQLVTVQRLTLARPAGADEFLAYFEKRVAKDGASLDVVKQSAAAAVFAVRFPKSDQNDEQVMICLAFSEPDAPARLNIVQYAIKPARVPVSVVEMRLRSWKDQFVRRAQALAVKPSAQ